MTAEIHTALSCLFDGGDLSSEQMQSAIAVIMDGRCTEAEIAALLTALKMQGETVEEIVGAVRAMQARAVNITTGQSGLLDTCGTGGDELSTFNISTATALLVAATGVPVAKHGNRSVSSTSGSSDVLQALGVNIFLESQQVARCVDEIGIGFCFAPLFHGAMKHAAPVRKQLGFRTIFNLLGPLTNPAGAEYQLVGANRDETAEKLAHALAQLGRKRALVVCGAGELDEISLWGQTTAFFVEGRNVWSEIWTPKTFALPACRVEDLQVDSAEESADVIRRVFAGELGATRNIVLANSAAALIAAQHVDNVEQGVERAAAAIDSGSAAKLCRRLVEMTNA